MKFGIMNLFPADEGNDHQIVRETLEEIQIADDLGYDSCWLAEHHFSRYGILGNPLMLRHPLEAGVRVIGAHCANLGESPDLDADADPARAPRLRNFDLFARLMREPRYAKLLHGDLSAVTQANRAETVPTILATTPWHGRLLNGSDYPLPGIMPVFSVQGLARDGLLEDSAVAVLQELRHVNPLLFDFVLKRSLSWKGARLPAKVFETRGFFDRAAGRA